MSFFKTRITELFGIEYPIVQGGMGAGFVSTPELTAAVAEAGGIGFMSAIQWRHEHSQHKLEEAIKQIKDMTDKPWGINVTLFNEVHRKFFLNVFELCEKYKVPAIETSARSPQKYVEAIKATGSKWIHKVARVKDGVKAQKLGADAVIIIGSEEGGHPGAERNATSVVGPLLVDLVDLPVVIGGGLCDGRGLVAALAFGGEGIIMGTRFCASEECVIHPKAKQSIIDMNYNETDYILMSIGDPVRCLRNELSQAVLKCESVGDQQGAIKLVLPLEQADEEGKMCVNTGEMDSGLAPWGMVGGRIHEIKPVKKIIDDIIAEAETVLGKLGERKYWKAP